jgi:hypothetical protein
VLIFDATPRANAVLRCPPSRRGIVSWNASEPEGGMLVRVRFADESWSGALPYVRWSPASRLSLGGGEPRARFEIDVLLTTDPFTAIEVQASTKLDAIALATPPHEAPRDLRPEPIELDVPQRSQYDGAQDRGWCSPASLVMLLGANGITLDIAQAAAATYDEAYHGTGNWAFNVAYASRFGLRAFVAYLRDLIHARSFLAAGVPLALSLAWKAGELEGAPLPESTGHIVVLRGFDSGGNPIVNDPAQPSIRTTYPREQFQRLWLAHGGVAYVIAPRRTATVDIANE